MTPKKFEESNFTFTKPSRLTDEECAPLPVWKGVDTNGNPLIISCWELSKEEIEELTRTGVIYLGVWSTGHPPVLLTAHKPIFS